MLQIWLSQVLWINSNLVSLTVSCLTKFLAFCVTMRNNIFFLTFAVSNCGQYWYAYKSGCLRLFEEHKNWVAANQHCATFNMPDKGNGRLISIFSQDDNNQIVNLRSSKDFPQGMKSHNPLRVYLSFFHDSSLFTILFIRRLHWRPWVCQCKLACNRFWLWNLLTCLLTYFVIYSCIYLLNWLFIYMFTIIGR